MSTDYYLLRAPFTKAALVESQGGEPEQLRLWQGELLAGVLFLRRGTGDKVLDLLVEKSVAPLHTHFGGPEVGCVVTESIPGLPNDTWLVSEYGEGLTVGDVRAMAGKGRAE